MEYNHRLDKFANEHTTIFLIFFIPLALVVMTVWGIWAFIENLNMNRKGYYWYSDWGGYRNPETGDWFEGWT